VQLSKSRTQHMMGRKTSEIEKKSLSATVAVKPSDPKKAERNASDGALDRDHHNTHNIQAAS
jgi:hypothetical protein